MFSENRPIQKYQYHIQLAIFLSFVAGLVNVCSILSLQRLTTNVTGHFAFFVEEIFQTNYFLAFKFLLFVFFFFFGSFTSNLMVEIISKVNARFKYTIPVILEAILLFICGGAFTIYQTNHPDLIAITLLFSMGLQNSLVTRVSNSVVRTTHLTGIFTDLGIEVSQLFFIKNKIRNTKTKASIQLKLTIIACFFIGGLVGGLVYSWIGLRTLWIAVVVLIIAAFLNFIKKQLFKFSKFSNIIKPKNSLER